VDLVEQNVGTKGKIVVFTGRRRDCEELHAAIRKVLPTEVPVWMGHGGTPTGVRDGIREAYMAQPGPCVLVGTGDAWGESVNLQDTDLAIISMLPYTPGQVIQWEGRFSRQGQKRPVLIQYLIAEGTIDEHVSLLLIDKLPSVEKVVKDEQVAGFGKTLSGMDDEQTMMSKLVSKAASWGEDDGD
jgi:SNF2 family DNA or RNA helicase